jgi:hypothetical protein
VSSRLDISIVAFDDLTLDRATGVPNGSRSGWRVQAKVDNIYLLIDEEFTEERDVRNALYRLADKSIPKYGAK